MGSVAALRVAQRRRGSDRRIFVDNHVLSEAAGERAAEAVIGLVRAGFAVEPMGIEV